MRYMLIGSPEYKQLSLTKGWFVSCLSSSPESAQIDMVTQSSACGRSDAVATERLSLFLVACLPSLFFILCHGGSRAWLYHSWFSVPRWILTYWIAWAALGAYAEASPEPPCPPRSAEQWLLPSAPQCYMARKRQMNCPLQVSCAMYLLTIFKQGLQGSASAVAVSGKGEAEGWCCYPQLFWMLPVWEIDLYPLPERLLCARAGVEKVVWSIPQLLASGCANYWTASRNKTVQEMAVAEQMLSIIF